MTMPSPSNSTTTTDLPTVFPLRDPPIVRLPVPLLGGASLLGAGLGGVLGLLVGVRPWPALASHALAPLASIAGGVLAFVLAWVQVQRVLRAIQAKAARQPRLVLDHELALLDGDRRTSIFPLDRRFGLTLFANPSREELVLAITHRDGVEYVAGRRPTGQRHVEILARATTTPDNDLPVSDQLPTFEDGDRLLDLVAVLEARQPGALERVFLSDAGMADVVLDGRKLRAAQLDFDLASPIAWRAYAFQEGTSYASHSFQATHVRQGEREVVLVALSPTGELATPSIIHPPAGHTGPLASELVQRALARDLRLAHCLAEVPPPRNIRVAVDRLFVPRLRHALDVAPSEVVIVERTSGAPEGVLLTPPEGVERLRQSSPDVR